MRFCAFVIADAVGVRRSRLRIKSIADVSFFRVLIGLAFGNLKSAMLKGDGSRVGILLKRCTVSNLLPKTVYDINIRRALKEVNIVFG